MEALNDLLRQIVNAPVDRKAAVPVFQLAGKIGIDMQLQVVCAQAGVVGVRHLVMIINRLGQHRHAVGLHHGDHDPDVRVCAHQRDLHLVGQLLGRLGIAAFVRKQIIVSAPTAVGVRIGDINLIAGCACCVGFGQSVYVQTELVDAATVARLVCIAGNTDLQGFFVDNRRLDGERVGAEVVVIIRLVQVSRSAQLGGDCIGSLGQGTELCPFAAIVSFRQCDLFGLAENNGSVRRRHRQRQRSLAVNVLPTIVVEHDRPERYRFACADGVVVRMHIGQQIFSFRRYLIIGAVVRIQGRTRIGLLRRLCAERFQRIIAIRRKAGKLRTAPLISDDLQHQRTHAVGCGPPVLAKGVVRPIAVGVGGEQRNIVRRFVFAVAVVGQGAPAGDRV